MDIYFKKKDEVDDKKLWRCREYRNNRCTAACRTQNDEVIQQWGQLKVTKYYKIFILIL